MLETLRRYFRYTSWPILAAMITLMAIGITAIRVSEQSAGTDVYWLKQLQFGLAALAVFFVMTIIPYQRLGRMAYLLFGLTLVLLLVVFALPAIKGSHRWIDVKIFMIQPSEVAKLSYIILLAWYLRYRNNYRYLRGLIAPFVLTLIPMALILPEPDLGTSLLFLPTLYFMLFMAGAKIRHLLGIIAVATVLMVLPIPHRLSSDMPAGEQTDRKALAYCSLGNNYLLSAAPLVKMEKHQLARLVGWLRQNDPDVAMGQGYQLHQSKITLASGGLTGHDLESNEDDPSPLLPHLLPLLPEDHTDFIFSVVGGRWGFLGALAMIFLYGVIFLFGAEIATITNDPFGRLLAVGVLALIFSQMVINVGITMGLMPITGMTLPLVSYGGTSLVVNCAALGLLVNVGQRRPVFLGRSPFEFGARRETGGSFMS